MGIIYKATNTLTGESYIGATHKTLPRRRSQHIYEAKNGRHPNAQFGEALLRYKDHFDWVVLREVEDAELAAAEVKTILEARDVGVSLYNAKLVVPSPLKGRTRPAEVGAKITAAKTKMSFEKKSYHEWATELGVTYKTIHKRMRHHGTPYRSKARPQKRKAVPRFDGKSYAELAAELGIKYHTLHERIRRTGSPYLQQDQNND